MEQILLKLARQLDSLDEASLLSLWEEYAQRVNKFEPTKRWEEAVLVLSLIQAKHWKNQLFNQQFSAHVRPEFQGRSLDRPFDFSLEKPKEPQQKATILQFRPKQNEMAENVQDSLENAAAPAQSAECADNPDYTPN